MTAVQLPLRARVKPSAQRVFDIIEEASGAWVSGITLNNLLGGWTHSQRISELIAAGYPVERDSRTGGVQRYRLVTR